MDYKQLNMTQKMAKPQMTHQRTQPRLPVQRAHTHEAGTATHTPEL